MSAWFGKTARWLAFEDAGQQAASSSADGVQMSRGEALRLAGGAALAVGATAALIDSRAVHAAPLDKCLDDCMKAVDIHFSENLDRTRSIFVNKLYPIPIWVYFKMVEAYGNASQDLSDYYRERADCKAACQPEVLPPPPPPLNPPAPPPGGSVPPGVGCPGVCPAGAQCQVCPAIATYGAICCFYPYDPDGTSKCCPK